MVRKIEGFHKKQVQGGINTFRSKLPPLHSKTIFYAKIDLCPNIPTAKVSALSLLFVLPPSSLLVATVQCQECQCHLAIFLIGKAPASQALTVWSVLRNLFPCTN